MQIAQKSEVRLQKMQRMVINVCNSFPSSIMLVQATAYSVRDRLIESWNDTQQYFKDQDPKRVYYLSMEFLMGKPGFLKFHPRVLKQGINATDN